MTDLSALDAAVSSVEAETAAQTDVQASASLLLEKIAALLQENATDPAAVQALADRLSSAASSGASANEALAAAVTANTPAAPA